MNSLESQSIITKRIKEIGTIRKVPKKELSLVLLALIFQYLNGRKNLIMIKEKNLIQISKKIRNLLLNYHINFYDKPFDLNGTILKYHIYNEENEKYLDSIPKNYQNPLFECIIHYPIYYEKSQQLIQQYSPIPFQFLYVLYQLKNDQLVETIPKGIHVILKPKKYPCLIEEIKFDAPKNIKILENYSLIESNLKSINLEDTSILHIGNYVFEMNFFLEKIIFPHSLITLNLDGLDKTKVKIIESNCYELKGFYSNIEILRLPNVKYIETRKVFRKLKELVVNSSLLFIKID